MADQWLSIVEYARQFNMSDMTVRRRIKTGKINAVLRDGKYFIPASEAIRKMTQSSTAMNHAPAPTHAMPPLTQQRPVNPPLVKSRPQVEPHFAPAHHHQQAQQQRPQAQHFAAPTHHDHNHNHNAADMVPQSLRQHTLAAPSAMVDTNTLLAFCDATLRKTNEAEQRLDQYYKEMMARLQADITQRDQQIKQLAQQVEDLQLLTKILERKIRSPA